MKGKSLTMLAVGDLILEKPDGEFYLSPVAPVLRTGDVVVGNGEIVFTDRGIATYVEMYPSPGCPSGNMGALASAGFNVITLASNHVYDRGAPGIEDTVALSGRRIVPVQTRPSSERFQNGATARVVAADGRLFSVSARIFKSPLSTRQTRGGCGNVRPFNFAAFRSDFS